MRGPLTKILLVVPDDAKAAVLVTRLRIAVLTAVDKVFMTVLLVIYFICLLLSEATYRTGRLLLCFSFYRFFGSDPLYQAGD